MNQGTVMDPLNAMNIYLNCETILHDLINKYDQIGVIAVDLQNGFAYRDEWNKEVLLSVNKLLTFTRSKNISIIYLRTLYDFDCELPFDDDYAMDIIDIVKPTMNDNIIVKEENDGFDKTNLYDVLVKMGVSNIILLGGNSTSCLKETFDSAVNLGYTVILPLQTIVHNERIAKSSNDKNKYYCDILRYYKMHGGIVTDMEHLFEII